MGFDDENLRPGEVAKRLGIPARRLIHWRDKGYAPADGDRSPGGGIATYTVTGSVACGLLDRFIEREGLTTEAALMIKNTVMPVMTKVLRLRKERGENLWLIVSDKAIVGMFPSGPKKSVADQDDSTDLAGHIKLIPIEGTHIYVSETLRANFGDSTCISYYNVTSTILDIIDRLGVEL